MLLKTFAASIAIVCAGVVYAPVATAAIEDWPEEAYGTWQWCTEALQQHCIETATLDGKALNSTLPDEDEAGIKIAVGYDYVTGQKILNWAVVGSVENNWSVPEWGHESEFHAVLRTGNTHLKTTYGSAKNLSVAHTLAPNANKLEIWATPVNIHVGQNCNLEKCDWVGVRTEFRLNGQSEELGGTVEAAGSNSQVVKVTHTPEGSVVSTKSPGVVYDNNLSLLPVTGSRVSFAQTLTSVQLTAPSKDAKDAPYGKSLVYSSSENQLYPKSQ